MEIDKGTYNQEDIGLPNSGESVNGEQIISPVEPGQHGREIMKALLRNVGGWVAGVAVCDLIVVCRLNEKPLPEPVELTLASAALACFSYAGWYWNKALRLSERATPKGNPVTQAIKNLERPSSAEMAGFLFKKGPGLTHLMLTTKNQVGPGPLGLPGAEKLRLLPSQGQTASSTEIINAGPLALTEKDDVESLMASLSIPARLKEELRERFRAIHVVTAEIIRGESRRRKESDHYRKQIFKWALKKVFPTVNLPDNLARKGIIGSVRTDPLEKIAILRLATLTLNFPGTREGPEVLRLAAQVGINVISAWILQEIKGEGSKLSNLESQWKSYIDNQVLLLAGALVTASFRRMPEVREGLLSMEAIRQKLEAYLNSNKGRGTPVLRRLAEILSFDKLSFPDLLRKLGLSVRLEVEQERERREEKEGDQLLALEENAVLVIKPNIRLITTLKRDDLYQLLSLLALRDPLMPCSGEEQLPAARNYILVVEKEDGERELVLKLPRGEVFRRLLLKGEHSIPDFDLNGEAPRRQEVLFLH